MVKILFFALILLFISCYSPSLIYAESTKIGIFPPITYITVKDPSTVSTTITLSNLSNNLFRGELILKGFTGSEEGKITFIENNKLPQSYKNLFSSIMFESEGKRLNEIVLQAREKKNITVIIPFKTTKQRDYYFTLLFISKYSKSDQSNVNIPVGIGTNFIVSYKEKPRVEAKIVKFYTSKFFTHGPIPFSILIKNTGNQFITPVGKIVIKNIFGQEVGSVNLLPVTILATQKGSERYLIDKNQIDPKKVEYSLSKKHSKPVAIWPESFIFGIYKAELQISTYKSDSPIKESLTFIGFPVYPIIALSSVFFIILGIYFRVRKKIKRK